MSEYIFKENAENKLVHGGDFESLYANVDDSWGQSSAVRGDYLISRKKQLEIISSYIPSGSLLGVGCGLGFTAEYYSKKFDVTGMDISKIAIAKAQLRFPHLRFIPLDIRFDFGAALNTLVKHIKSDGKILVSNFIFDKNNQKYGKECFFGHTEILNWMEGEANSVGLKIESYSCTKLDKKYFFYHSDKTL
jgi:SAM-dependent methyltransferase